MSTKLSLTFAIQVVKFRLNLVSKHQKKAYLWTNKRLSSYSRVISNICEAGERRSSRSWHLWQSDEDSRSVFLIEASSKRRFNSTVFHSSSFKYVLISFKIDALHLRMGFVKSRPSSQGLRRRSGPAVHWPGHPRRRPAQPGPDFS